MKMENLKLLSIKDLQFCSNLILQIWPLCKIYLPAKATCLEYFDGGRSIFQLGIREVTLEREKDNLNVKRFSKVVESVEIKLSL